MVRELVPNSQLMRCESRQVGHHHCCNDDDARAAASSSPPVSGSSSRGSANRRLPRSSSSRSSSNNCYSRRWVGLAAALASVLVVLPSSSPLRSTTGAAPLLVGVVQAAAVTAVPPSFGRRSRNERGTGLHCEESSGTNHQQAFPAPRLLAAPQNHHGRRRSHDGRSSVVPRGGASATVVAASAVTTVPMPSSVDIVTSSYELVRSGGLVALWYALRRTFGTVSDGVHVALRQSTTAKFLLSGAVAGIVSRTAVSPLEVVATSQMVRGGDQHMVQELAHLFQTEGVRGFFKGNAANCLKVAPTRGVQFFAFEALKKRLVEWKRKRTGDPSATLAPAERLVAGGFAGMIASSIVYPLEPVKTMLTMYPGKYPGIGAAFSGILRQAGIGGLYKGLKPTLIAMFPYVGVEFMIYETSKIAVEALLARRAAANGGKAGRHDETIAVALPVIVSLGLGALAGAAAQTSAHPLDVVRKRLQVQGLNGNPVLYKNAVDCFSKVARNEGVSALYKGLGPACVATIPGTGIAYITYEAMKRFLGLESV